MNKKRLTKKHYAVILTALELSLADRSDEMTELISEIQDIIYPRTTDKLIDKWNVSYHTWDCNHPEHEDYDMSIPNRA
mgnify:CR=1 FL=1|tara:strand:+ start:373 stop:606 length:234 start_codon:yes stop_codon:yes gene_type:complete